MKLIQLARAEYARTKTMLGKPSKYYRRRAVRTAATLLRAEKVQAVAPGFYPYVGVTWGPFTDGRVYETGRLVGPGGATVRDVVVAATVGFGAHMRTEWVGDWQHASRCE